MMVWEQAERQATVHCGLPTKLVEGRGVEIDSGRSQGNACQGLELKNRGNEKLKNGTWELN